MLCRQASEAGQGDRRLAGEGKAASSTSQGTGEAGAGVRACRSLGDSGQDLPLGASASSSARFPAQPTLQGCSEAVRETLGSGLGLLVPIHTSEQGTGGRAHARVCTAQLTVLEDSKTSPRTYLLMAQLFPRTGQHGLPVTPHAPALPDIGPYTWELPGNT